MPTAPSSILKDLNTNTRIQNWDWMVDIKSIEKNFRRFQGRFCQDIIDLNFEGSVDANKLKTKMVESELFKSIQDFAKERRWDVESKDLKILARKGEEIVDINLVGFGERTTLCIIPWSQILEKLRRIEESTKD